MKKNSLSNESHIKPQFIFDNAGNKKAVILDIATFESLVEELQDVHLEQLDLKELIEGVL